MYQQADSSAFEMNMAGKQLALKNTVIIKYFK